MRHARTNLTRDLCFVALSIAFAIGVEYFNVLDALLRTWGEYAVTLSIIAGFFFTSLFTIAPAGVMLAELSQAAPLVPVAVFGAAGAVMGDLVLFLFVRDAMSEDIAHMIKRSWKRRLMRIAHHPLLQWVVPLTGAIIIASPLPDELGLAMMGLSKTRVAILIPVSFAMNFLGILIVGLSARVL